MGRWLSPKASTGVAGGMCVHVFGGWVCVSRREGCPSVCECIGFLLERMDGGAPVQKDFFW